MDLFYSICQLLPFEMLRWEFMCNALLAILLMAPLFGLMSTMIVTGRMSFFSDALGHSAFTGIAIGSIFGIALPTAAAVLFSIVFALLFSWIRAAPTRRQTPSSVCFPAPLWPWASLSPPWEAAASQNTTPTSSATFSPLLPGRSAHWLWCFWLWWSSGSSPPTG